MELLWFVVANGLGWQLFYNIQVFYSMETEGGWGVRKYEHEPLNYYSDFWETEPLEIFRVFTKLLNWIVYIYTSE